MSDAKRWYMEEGPNGWMLNEHIPNGSDGFLADFGYAEEQCRQAAHEHNCHAELLAACKAFMEELAAYEGAYDQTYPDRLFARIPALMEAAIAKAEGV